MHKWSACSKDCQAYLLFCCVGCQHCKRPSAVNQSSHITSKPTTNFSGHSRVLKINSLLAQLNGWLGAVLLLWRLLRIVGDGCMHHVLCCQAKHCGQHYIGQNAAFCQPFSIVILLGVADVFPWFKWLPNWKPGLERQVCWVCVAIEQLCWFA